MRACRHTPPAPAHRRAYRSRSSKSARLRCRGSCRHFFAPPAMSPDKCPWLRSGHLADDRNLKADNSFFVPFAGVFSVRRVHVIRKSAPLRAAIYGFPAVDFPSPAGEKLGISRRIPAFSLQILRQNPRGGHLLLPPAILVVPLSLWKPLLRPRQDNETARQRAWCHQWCAPPLPVNHGLFSDIAALKLSPQQASTLR